MMNWVLHHLPQEGGPKIVNLPEPKMLEWKVNELVKNFLRKSLENYTKLADNIEVTVLQFKGYGSNWVKQTKLPPGSFGENSI